MVAEGAAFPESKAVEGLATSEELKKLNDTVKQVSEAVTAMKENGKGAGVKKTLATEIKENKEALKDIVQTGKGEVTVKATVLRASVAGNQQAVELPDIGQLAYARLTAYDIFRRIPVSK